MPSAFGSPRGVFTVATPPVAARRFANGCRPPLRSINDGLRCCAACWNGSDLRSGGQAGQRLLQQLGLGHRGVSRNSVLRVVRQAMLPTPPTPQVLGVDDWSFRRGQTYGTILSDLERHHVVDLLARPERSDTGRLAGRSSRRRRGQPRPGRSVCGRRASGCASCRASG